VSRLARTARVLDTAKQDVCQIHLCIRVFCRLLLFYRGPVPPHYLHTPSPTDAISFVVHPWPFSWLRKPELYRDLGSLQT
jgi:hypothetical protein